MKQKKEKAEILGVCSTLANMLNADANTLRIFFIIGTFCTYYVPLIYLFLAVFFDIEDQKRRNKKKKE